MVMVWGIIAMLFCRYTVPGVNKMDTVIDMSKLAVKPVPEMESPIRTLPQQEENPVPPQTKPDEPTVQAEERPIEHLDVPPPREEVRPAISRPTIARQYDEPAPVTQAQRMRVGEQMANSEIRIKRGASSREMPAETAAERRTRAYAISENPENARAASVRRRSSSVEQLQPGVPVAQRLSTRPNISDNSTSLPSAQIKRSSKTTEAYAQNAIPANNRVTAPAASDAPSPPSTRIKRLSKTTEAYAQNVIPAKDRIKAPAVADGKEGSSREAKHAMTRGVSLTSLDICSSQQEQEDKVRSVLNVVGSRQSCSDDTGEYQFKGTQRVSSFNLMIYPAKGRRPSNRCEELGNAYRCLKTR